MISLSFSDSKNGRSSRRKGYGPRPASDHNGLIFAGLSAQPLGLAEAKFYPIFVVTGPFSATIFICGRATIFYAENRRRFVREICLVGAPYWHRHGPEIRCRSDR